MHLIALVWESLSNIECSLLYCNEEKKETDVQEDLILGGFVACNKRIFLFFQKMKKECIVAQMFLSVGEKNSGETPMSPPFF